MDAVNVPAINMKSVALPAPEIIDLSIAVFGGGCEPPTWQRGGRRGSRWYRSKSVGEFV